MSHPFEMSSVTVDVVGGPSVNVPWFQGMNAQQALEGAFAQINDSEQFTYALQYYGAQLGYLVVMINETYDSFASSSNPYFYWEFLLNGAPSQVGIDGIVLQPNDVVGFQFEMYSQDKHRNSTVQHKYSRQFNLLPA